MSNRDQALEFVRCFADGDIDGLEPLLAEGLHLVGPYLRVDSRAAYLDVLRQDPPGRCGVRVLSVTENDDTVAIFYDYEKSDQTVAIAQLFRFKDQVISEIRLVFDGRKPKE